MNVVFTVSVISRSIVLLAAFSLTTTGKIFLSRKDILTHKCDQKLLKTHRFVLQVCITGLYCRFVLQNQTTGLTSMTKWSRTLKYYLSNTPYPTQLPVLQGLHCDIRKRFQANTCLNSLIQGTCQISIWTTGHVRWPTLCNHRTKSLHYIITTPKPYIM